LAFRVEHLSPEAPAWRLLFTLSKPQKEASAVDIICAARCSVAHGREATERAILRDETMKSESIETSIDLRTANGTTELESQIQCRLSGQIWDFRLDVVDKGLILRGHAQTFCAKQLAQHAVIKATRLPILANEIVVS